jgi:hypothetical protein
MALGHDQLSDYRISIGYIVRVDGRGCSIREDFTSYGNADFDFD